MTSLVASKTLDDLVLLDEIDEECVVKTLQSRYEAENIYTYIGPVLIALNPYKLIHKVSSKR